MRKVPKEGCHQLESASGDHPDLPRTEGLWGAGFCFKTKLGPTKSLHPNDKILEFRPDITRSEEGGIWLITLSFIICKRWQLTQSETKGNKDTV